MITAALMACASLFGAIVSSPEAPPVSLVRLPEGGIQPQAVADDSGNVHVLYYTGAPAGGDLFYSRLEGSTFSEPIRVNTIAGSAIAAGSVRGGQMALGRNGRVHVAWNGAKGAGESASNGPQMWYARLDPVTLRFETQRDVSATADALDGGGSIAADRAGNVHVVWHARGEQAGEEHRTVYIARSKDDGTTFARAEAVTTGTGACGCCGLRALTDRDGRLHVLYRAAIGGTQRGATWLMSSGNAHRAPVRLHDWELRQCPMSTFALADAGRAGVAAAWETEKQIFLSTLDPVRRTFSTPVAMSGAGVRRLPSIAVNRSGARLVTWTEGTAWMRGGTVAWELFDASGRSLASARDAGAVPVWSLVAAVARPDGSFMVIH